MKQQHTQSLVARLRRWAKAIACVLALLVPALSAAAQGVGDTCFLVADNDGPNGSQDVMTRLDRPRGQEFLVGVTGTEHVEALAFNPANGQFYAVDGKYFGMMNPVTGAFAQIGKVGRGKGALGEYSFDDVDGLAFDPHSGTLYGTVREALTNLLIRIDPATGAAIPDAFGLGFDYAVVTPIGSTKDVDDIAIHPVNGNLYAVLNEEGTPGQLVMLNKAVGGALRLATLDVPDVEGLSFDDHGTLLGVMGDRAMVVAIDLSDGSTTEVATLGIDGNGDYESIACPVTARLSTAVAPTLTLPEEVTLHQNYPNPFNPQTVIRFTLDAPTEARVAVYDVLGRQVAVLAEGLHQAGQHEVTFSGVGLPNGAYLYRLDTPRHRITRTMLMVQ